MDIRLTSITIWNNKAYIPTPARYANNGLFTEIEPVNIVDLIQSELFSLVQTRLYKELVILPQPTPKEFKLRKDLLPKLTGARSWKRLSMSGMAYNIVLTEKELTLEISKLDKKGRWIFPLENQIKFAVNTDLSLVIQTMLSDLEKRKKIKDERAGNPARPPSV